MCISVSVSGGGSRGSSTNRATPSSSKSGGGIIHLYVALTEVDADGLLHVEGDVPHGLGEEEADHEADAGLEEGGGGRLLG